MKKILSLILIVASLLTVLVSCDLGGGGGNAAKYGLVTEGGKQYFIAEGGAILLDGTAASSVAAPTVTATLESKKFTAPETSEAHFTYELVSGKVNITGLTDAGKSAGVVIIPKTIDGKTIASISSLEGAKSVVFADLGNGINLNSGCFKGVSNVFICCVADNLLVAQSGLLEGSSANVYVSADEISNFKSHYNWSAYADSLKKF